MVTIERLVNQFREAIDRAKYNDEFYNITPFCKFPKGCCDVTCDLLAHFLSNYRIETCQVNGKYWDGILDNTQNHVWLLTKDGIIIDITGDQFKDDSIFLNYNKPVHVGMEDDLHKLFNEERRIEDNFELKGIPNVRRRMLNRAYEKISKYL